tara:strand:+ start:56 stop:1747 length:1692 start_codon:yes stop_codon:yes gene_type:complete
MSNSIGFITAFDDSFYEDFKLFLKSLRHFTNIPLYVVPISDEPQLYERIASMSKGEFCNHKVKDNLFIKTGDNRHIQWHKAHIIKNVMQVHQLKQAIWIDSDTIILDDPSQLFHKLNDKFLITKDYFAPLSCKNDQSLYDQFPEAKVPPLQEDIVINSGVVGVQYPRDIKIIESWIDKTSKVIADPSLKEKVALYDQGTLLWTLRELKLLNVIIDDPSINGNAKRNGYERHTKTKWPSSIIGGTLLEEIKTDNPDKIVAHYAGLPKLSHLCHVNHSVAITHNRHKHKDKRYNKIIGVGLERAGTHTLATILRKCCTQNSWIRHEFSDISKCSYDKVMTGEYNLLDLKRAIEILERTDVQFVAEINHRFYPFIEDIMNISKFKDTLSFILQLRNPVDLIRSRLYNGTIWDLHNPSNFINKLPIYYQCDLYKIKKHDHLSNRNQNTFRPYDNLDDDIIDLHLYEITLCLETILKQFESIPENRKLILSLENADQWCEQLQKIIPPDAMDWSKISKYQNRKYGANQGLDEKSKHWIEKMLNIKKNEINHKFYNILHKYNINSDLII